MELCILGISPGCIPSPGCMPLGLACELSPSLMYPPSPPVAWPAMARFCCASARFALTSAERSLGAVLPRELLFVW